jgi:protein involved in polysaccharide export with SLBB domain
MKKLLFAITITSVSLVSAAAQVKTSETSGQPRELVGATVANGGHARILGIGGRANQSGTAKAQAAAITNASPKGATPPWGGSRVSHSTNAPAAKTRPRTTTGPLKRLNAMASPMALSEIYRVGIGDVLDVQLVDTPTMKSTLFTVLDRGVLEYPLFGDPLPVAGLTADEIATRLRASIKVLENPRVIVTIRDYASHTAQITGLVSNPGTMFLRREAIPFYVVLAGAEPRAEAVRATISRSGQKEIQIALNDQQSLATLVQPGDVIKILGRPAQPAEYFYVTGAINSPGQKVFHSGLTLAQAIILSGGLTRSAISRVKVLRQGTDGRLTATEYDLRQIEAGKLADPVLLPGDRVAAP